MLRFLAVTSRLQLCLNASAVYGLSSGIVLLGGFLAVWLRPELAAFETALERFDAAHYKEIAETGYRYDPQRRSNVAFFPLFPLSARWTRQLTGWSTTPAMLLTSNAFLLGAFLAFAFYLADRERPSLASGSVQKAIPPVSSAALTIFGLWPTTFFFRMPYSESTFLLLAIVAMLGIARRWPALYLAPIVGAATAARPVGVALLVPLTLYLLQKADWRKGIMKCMFFLPLACWGLLAYMGFQYVEFGDPLAFAKTQAHWRVRGSGDAIDKFLTLMSAEPIWGSYVVGSPYYQDDDTWLPLSLVRMNPLYLIGTLILVVVGAWKKWLTREEIGLSVALLAIAYVARGYEWGCLSQGRFAAVVFPVYIVMGHLLSRLPSAIAFVVSGLFGFLLGAYALMFADGRSFF